MFNCNTMRTWYLEGASVSSNLFLTPWYFLTSCPLWYTCACWRCISYVLAICIALPPIQGVYIHQQYSGELSELKGGQDLSFVLLDNALFANNPKWHFKLGCYTTNFFLLNENKLSICSRPVKSNRLSARRLAGLFELKFYVLCVDANQRIKSKVFL